MATPAIEPVEAVTELGHEPDRDQPIPAADDFGINFRNLPRQLVEALESVTKEAQGQECAGRRIQMLEGYQNRQYYQDNQYIYLRGENDYCFSQAYPGASWENGDESGTFGNFTKSYNIFTPFATIQSAKLTENGPGIDFQPEDSGVDEDISAASAAEGMRKDFDRQNDVKELQKKFFYFLQMDGQVVIWNKTALDKSLDRKIGTCEMFGAVECKTPLYANCRADFWYVIAYKDPDIKTAKKKYWWIADKLTAGDVCLGEGQYERLCRLGVVRGAAAGSIRPLESINHLITEGYVWLRPAAWCDKKDIYDGPNGAEEYADPNTGETRTKLVRDKLDELFPDGVRALFVGHNYAECAPESMDHALIVSHAYLGTGQHRMAIMSPVINVQDETNTLINNASETRAYMNDETAVACGDEEYGAITKQQSQPGAWRQLKGLPKEADIRSRLMPIPGGKWDPSWQKFLEMLRQLPEFMLAVPPSIWGESVPGNETAQGLQLVSAQAMGVLGSLWVVMVAAFAQLYYHNCLMILADDDYPDEVTVTLGEGDTVKVQKKVLAGGKFKVFPDTQSGFPESTASERQVLDSTFEQLALTPLAPQIFGSPDNIAYYLQKKGITEIVIPEAVARNKQLREIESLLKASPIMNPALQQITDTPGVQIPDVIQAIKQQVQVSVQQSQVQHAGAVIAAQANGAMPPPPPPPPDPTQFAKSSIRVWPSDFHTYEAAKCKDWLSSDACYRELETGNIRGILNVMLHMMEHEMFEAKETPPPPAPMPMRPPRGKAGIGPAPPMPPPAAPGAPGAVQ